MQGPKTTSHLAPEPGRKEFRDVTSKALWFHFANLELSSSSLVLLYFIGILRHLLYKIQLEIVLSLSYFHMRRPSFR